LFSISDYDIIKGGIIPGFYGNGVFSDEYVENFIMKNYEKFFETGAVNNYERDYC